MTLVLPLFLTAIVWCGGPASPSSDETTASPFGRAGLAPADVSLFVHVEDAAGLRAELADRPIARWATMVLGEGELARAWRSLAAASGLQSDRLFDLCFGRDVTFLRRGQVSRGEWLVFTSMDPAAAELVLNRIKPRVLPPRDGAAMLELPEHQLLIARRGDSMLVAPVQQPALLHDVLSRLASLGRSRSNDEKKLPVHPALEHARALGEGRTGILVQHDPPLGGWTAAVASLDGNHVVIRQRSEFRNAPFTRDVTQIEIDVAPLQAFEGHALAAIVEPTDIGGSRLETYIVTRLGEHLISPQMRRNLGDRSIIVIGEIEGRQEPEPIDLQAPTLAVCFELRDPHNATEQLDRHMMNLGRRIKALGDGRFVLELPQLKGDRVDVRRQIDLSPAGEWLTGGLPVARPISLNWSVADGPLGNYYVIATHPAELNETVSVLTAEREPPEGCVGRFQGCGTANGLRISHHLRSWSDRPELFADAAQQNAFRESLLLMAELAGGMSRVRWQMARPSARTLELEVQIQLAPPESTRAE